MKRIVILAISLFCILLLAVTITASVMNTNDMQELLKQSIVSQLTSTNIAAREIAYDYHFERYTSLEAVEADEENYIALRGKLRTLAEHSGANYIYILRYIGGECQFVLDSDSEDEEVFIPYEPADIQLLAFQGHEDTAGINNLADEYGSFHSSAMPMYIDGELVAVICVDVADELLSASMNSARTNLITLIAALVVTLALLLVFILFLLRRVDAMQNELIKLAHYDTVTGLPNRQYLMEHLNTISRHPAKNMTFALMFIDLDNFKAVNDNAGHDAGDELLAYTAQYLQSLHKGSRSFRPSAGLLNVSARIGGDEFIQIIPNVESEEQAIELAESLLQGYTASTENRYIAKYNVGMSIGVALYPFHSENHHVLIKYADIAMYHAKHAGKNRWCIYNDELSPKDMK